MVQAGLFENVGPAPAPPACDTPEVVVGDLGEHVDQFMERPPENTLISHEYHGSPCFEGWSTATSYLLTMSASISATTATVRGNRLQRLQVRRGLRLRHRENEIHAVYTLGHSRSLRAYLSAGPDTATSTTTARATSTARRSSTCA